MMSKKLILITALLLVIASNSWAYNEQDLAKLKALNACVGCDLSGANFINADLTDTDLENADLTRAILSGADLTTSNLRNAKLDGAKFCKTKMPWGEVNDDCED